MNKSLLCSVIVAPLVGSVAEAADPVFSPIPDADKPLYEFNFEKWFYVDQAARQKDFAELKRLTGEVMALKGEVGTNPANLLAALELKRQMGVIADKLQSYGGLRQAVNVNDTVANEEDKEGQDARDNFDADTAFVESAVQALDETGLKSFIGREPGLEQYEFLLRSWQRMKPHRASEPVEMTLSRLGPGLDPFRKSFRTLLIKRSPDAIIQANNKELNVTTAGEYAEILRLDDRGKREAGFRKRMATYKAQSDVFAFGLYQKALAANDVAKIHDFANASDEALFDYSLLPSMVDNVLKGFRDHADLAIRFQKAEKDYQAKLLGLASAEPWDLEARPSGLPEPRFSITDTKNAVVESTKLFGPDYSTQLEQLYDAAQGRLDIVPGPNRTSGDFTWGYWGPSWVMYMQGYNGYLTDTVTFAHESAHVVHYRLIHDAGVHWYYGDGARYFTEGLAKINELLVLNHFAKTAKTDPERLYFLCQINSKLLSVKFASMYWAAYATSFEVETYRRINTSQVKKPEEIHEIWAEFGRLWMHDFDKFPDLKYVWADTPHFLVSPRVYSNYLFAWVISLAVYERLQADPAAAAQLVNLMKTGFPDQPAVLLKKFLNVDLSDPLTLERMFSLAEKQLVEFEKMVKAL